MLKTDGWDYRNSTFRIPTGLRQDTFTLSYITGRSVGIGAYLNRLGQRNIQMAWEPNPGIGLGNWWSEERETNLML